MANNKKNVKKTAPVQVEETPPPPVEVILPPIDDDEEERLLMEQLKATRARKAQREATAQILPLRQARAGELLHKHEEIKRRIFDLETQAGEILKEIDAVQRGDFDEDLTRTLISNATQIEIAPIRQASAPRPTGEKRERKLIVRRPLTEVIKSKTKFRINLRGVYYNCETENGGSFTGEGQIFKSLNQFCEFAHKESGGGGRKITAYESVEVFLIKNSGVVDFSPCWLKLGAVYDGSCESIN